jgi:hypothetical protein
MARFGGLRDGYALVDPMTGTQTRLVPPDAVDSEAAFLSLASLSPDGSGVLEVVRNISPEMQVFVRDLATGVDEPVVPGGLAVAGPTEYGLIPTWAPDGTVFITGGGALSQGTLLTITRAAAPAE